MSTNADRFRILDSLRTSKLERSRFCSSLTIPSVLPPEGWNEHYQESTLLFQDSKTKQVYEVVNWNSSFQKWSNDPIETWNNIRLDLFESSNWCIKAVS